MKQSNQTRICITRERNILAQSAAPSAFIYKNTGVLRVTTLFPPFNFTSKTISLVTKHMTETQEAYEVKKRNAKGNQHCQAAKEIKE